MTGGPTRRLRVVMLVENNGYPADIRVRAEAEALARAGHRVTVLAPRQAGEAARATAGDIAIHRFWLPKTESSILGYLAEYVIANVQLYLHGIRALIAGTQVVHLHNPPDTLFGLAILARITGRRAVFDHHDLAPELFQLKFDRRSLVRLLEWLERMSLRTANLVVASNDSHRAVAEGHGVASNRVAVVRNGPPAAWLDHAVDGREGVLDPVRLVFVGAMERQDGADALPHLLRLLEDAHGVNAELTLVGEGSSLPGIVQAAEELGVAGRLRAMGHVPHERVLQLIADADICLDPADGNALNHRSTMIKIAEYMAAGRPTVAYRLLETERTARDGVVFADCHDLGDFATQVARLARDSSWRRTVANRARRRARDLTWERSEEVLLTAYDRL